MEGGAPSAAARAEVFASPAPRVPLATSPPNRTPLSGRVRSTPIDLPLPVVQATLNMPEPETHWVSSLRGGDQVQSRGHPRSPPRQPVFSTTEGTGRGGGVAHGDEWASIAGTPPQPARGRARSREDDSQPRPRSGRPPRQSPAPRPRWNAPSPSRSPSPGRPRSSERHLNESDAQRRQRHAAERLSSGVPAMRGAGRGAMRELQAQLKSALGALAASGDELEAFRTHVAYWVWWQAQRRRAQRALAFWRRSAGEHFSRARLRLRAWRAEAAHAAQLSAARRAIAMAVESSNAATEAAEAAEAAAQAQAGQAPDAKHTAQQTSPEAPGGTASGSAVAFGSPGSDGDASAPQHGAAAARQSAPGAAASAAAARRDLARRLSTCSEELMTALDEVAVAAEESGSESVLEALDVAAGVAEELAADVAEAEVEAEAECDAAGAETQFTFDSPAARAGEGALGHTELPGSPSGRLGRSKSLGPGAVRERSLLAARLGPAARLSSAALEGAGNAVGAPSERPSEGYGAENVLRALGGALGRTNTMIVEVGPEGGLEAELFSLRERAARLQMELDAERAERGAMAGGGAESAGAERSVEIETRARAAEARERVALSDAARAEAEADEYRAECAELRDMVGRVREQLLRAQEATKGQLEGTAGAVSRLQDALHEERSLRRRQDLEHAVLRSLMAGGG